MSGWDEIEALIELSQAPIKPHLCLDQIPKNPDRIRYYRFLYHLARTYKPQLALEIGVQEGYGSGYMCEAGIQVIGIDLEQVDLFRVNYHFIRGDSTKVFDQVSDLVDRFGKLGLVFQDSSHHYEPSKTEWGLYSGLLADGAVWVCDDITEAFYDPLVDPPGKGMVQYFEELPGDKRLYENSLHNGNAMGVVLI
jgi:predicted O-methyltransferase YrrM